MSLEDLLNLYIFHMPDFLSKYSFASVANQIGCPEGALKLIFSLLIAYPIGILYQLLIIKCPLNVKHLYFATLGFSIGYMNYGLNLIHSLIAIIIVRLILVGLRGNKIAGPVCFTFCTSYLLWGYYKTQSEVYTFEWTIPQCVLTLRLIAVAFDVCDGYTSRDANPSSTGSSVSNDEALTQIPSFLELFGHSYFPASFLVGPQFGVKKYLDFVTHHHPVLQFSWKLGLSRLFLGFVYLLLFQLGSIYFPPAFLTTHDFTKLNFLRKLVIMTIVTKVQLCKYLCIWLFSEGSCIISGLNFDRQRQSFDSCRNVNVIEFESATTFNGLIKSFNISTNQWAAKYIFKRLRFLNSKFISHICTLLYLAMWHGWRSGYYVTFTMEFLIMKMEWEVQSMIGMLRDNHKSLDRLLDSFVFKWTFTIFMKVYTLVIFGYCLVPFIMLTYNRWFPILAQFYFFAHIIYLPWQLISPCIPMKKAKSHRNHQDNIQTKSESQDELN